MISDDDNDETATIPLNSIPFDTNTTVEHSYMGEMESLHGYCLYDEGTKVELLAVLTNTLACPGYTLPLICDESTFISNIKDVFNSSKTFAQIHIKSPNDPNRKIFPYGVTMNIFEYRDQEHSLFIKARGLQRFKIRKLDINPLSSIGKVLVEILPETKSESVLQSIQVSSLNKCRHCNNIRVDYQSGGCRRYDSSLLSLPHWVYQHSEPQIVVQELLKNLRIMFKFDEDLIPKDLTKLSYWFVQNIVFKHEIRLEMLSFNSAIDRLYFGLRALHNSYRICCKSCHKVIGDVSDFISMSKEGYISNFCNPEGNIFELITLSRITNTSKFPDFSREFSWFPGYAWCITICSYCHTQLGWKFLNHQMDPQFFWGIIKSKVTINKI